MPEEMGALKSGSNLERVLAAGEFAATAEIGPPMDCDASVVLKKAEILKGVADAYNITDNQTGVVRISSIAAALMILKQNERDAAQAMANIKAKMES